MCWVFNFKDGCYGLNGPYHSTQFWRRRTKLSFLWRVDMIFLSQIFPERSVHRDGLYLFSDFCVHFREGDIGDLEQKCLSGISLVLRSLSFLTKNSYKPSIKMIVSCGAFKTASSGMVRSAHGTHPLTTLHIDDMDGIGYYTLKWFVASNSYSWEKCPKWQLTIYLDYGSFYYQHPYSHQFTNFSNLFQLYCV